MRSRAVHVWHPLNARDQSGDGSESDAIRLKKLPNPLQITFPFEAHYYNHISFDQLELHLLLYLKYNPHNPLTNYILQNACCCWSSRSRSLDL